MKRSVEKSKIIRGGEWEREVCSEWEMDYWGGRKRKIEWRNVATKGREIVGGGELER